MRVELSNVSKGRHDRALPRTSLAFETTRATLACAETEQRPTVLGLIASGRMRPDAGDVAIDGRHDPAAIRRRVALIDAPEVCDPHPDVLTAGVVSEELMFAGRNPTPFAARRWLAEHGMDGIASAPFGTIEPAQRVRILLELAAQRQGVEGLVLVSPDRHGGEPDVWWRIAGEYAERGYGVLVIAGRASQTALAASGALTPDASDAEPARESEPAPAPAPRPAPAPEPEPALAPAPAPEAAPVREVESVPEPDPEPESEPTPEPGDHAEEDGTDA